VTNMVDTLFEGLFILIPRIRVIVGIPNVHSSSTSYTRYDPIQWLMSIKHTSGFV